jgi:outer membrane protein OmpA-like peptidoglycan-associated protein
MKLMAPFAVALGALGACTYSNTALINEVEKAQLTGDTFSRSLHAEYLNLAKAEAAEGDRRDARHFAMKAKTAAAGKPVAADNVEARDIKGTKDEKSLQGARADLDKAMKLGAAKRNPRIAANAQSMYDCWIQEAEEDVQPGDIKTCRNQFKTAMTLLAAEKTKVRKKRKLPASGSPFTVYFKFDSDKLTNSSEGAIFDIMQKVGMFKPKAVQIIAHTDLSGASPYNQTLSERRAAALEKYLKGAGAKKINVSAKGDTTPIVNTKKPNQTNRRAVIVFKKK